jgi:hypothetical protein
VSSDGCGNGDRDVKRSGEAAAGAGYLLCHGAVRALRQGRGYRIGAWEIIDGARTITVPGHSPAERVALGYDWLTPERVNAHFPFMRP